ncbi:MAG: MoaD/ThiS family protein [Streptosporangiaceae bacterium]|nr:MoaD/ThiS family protein [Streptosporangiaceae bacterium]
MAKVTIQYWAAARDAAGVSTEPVEAGTLAEALEAIVARRQDGRLRSVLATCSFLVDGAPAARAAAAAVPLADGARIEVLPQFAGG